MPAANYLIYDGACLFCTRFVRYVRLRDSIGPLPVIDSRRGGPEVDSGQARGLSAIHTIQGQDQIQQRRRHAAIGFAPRQAPQLLGRHIVTIGLGTPISRPALHHQAATRVIKPRFSQDYV